MLERNERVQSFLDAITKEALERRESISQEISELNAAELTKAEQEARERTGIMLANAAVKCSNEQNNRVAGERSRLRTALAQKRTDIADAVFALASEKLSAFVSCESYPAYLLSQAEELRRVFGSEQAELYVREADLPLAQQLQQSYGTQCTVLADASIQIGGLKARCESAKLFVDQTLDHELEQQRAWFLANSGMQIII